MAKQLKVLFTLSGEVIHGNALGRTVGMPTANMSVSGKKKIPPKGVYASLTDIDGLVYRSLTNVGTRPTVGKDSRIRIETHIFDFDQDIYGKIITIKLYLFIRPELCFSSLEEVKKQVEKDMEKAKQFLPENSKH